MEWTAERVELVSQLWKEGKSAEQIAAVLNCGATRNMVIGKVHRLGLMRFCRPRRPAAEPKKPASYKRRRPAGPKPNVGAILRIVEAPAPPSHPGYGCSIVEVTGCRWPVADNPALPGGFGFCNAPQCDGSAYCAGHQVESVAPYSRDLIRRTIKGVIKAVDRQGRAA